MQQNKHEQKLAMWLDCDPGLDDTFAIIYAASVKTIDLIGISTSPGNTCLANTTQNALNVLYNIGRKDIPVFAGSNLLIHGQMKLAEHMHGSNGLGGVELPKSPQKANFQQSFEKIYHLIKSQKKPIVWANTGSLTNLCILMLSYPDIKDNISKIVIMGGAIGKGNITPAAEFNIYFDPHAFDRVLKIKDHIPLVMIPLEVTHQNVATQAVIDHFKGNKHIIFAEAVYNMLLKYQEMYYNAYKFPFPPIHDPCTIFYALHPQQFQTKKAIIQVDTFEISYGRTNCFFSNPREPSKELQAIDLVATNLKNQKTIFWNEMQKILDHIFSQQIQKNIDY